jgi:hypothetical protein
MNNEEDVHAAKIYFQETNQKIIQMSNYIINIAGFTFALLGVIVTVFGNQYFHVYPLQKGYIFMLAAFLCSLTLGMWRWFTHIIDNDIAALYPNMIFYEDIISLEIKGPTHKHLETIPNINKIILENITPNERREKLEKLFLKRRMGSRGHGELDWIAFILLIIIIAISIIYTAFWDMTRPFSYFNVIGLYLGQLLGLFFWLWGRFISQKDN